MKAAKAIAFVLLAVSLAFAQNAGIDQFGQAMISLYQSLAGILPVVSMLLIVTGAVIYGAGQILGAETRARAVTWATACLTGALVSVLVVTVSPPIFSALYGPTWSMPTSVGGCNSDAQCAGDYHCNVATHLCEARQNPTVCDATNPCISGYTCLSGTCVVSSTIGRLGGPCASGTPACSGPGVTCSQSGSCVSDGQFGSACRNAGDCAAGQHLTCRNGLCAGDRQTGAPCNTNSDCISNNCDQGTHTCASGANPNAGRHGYPCRGGACDAGMECIEFGGDGSVCSGTGEYGSPCGMQGVVAGNDWTDAVCSDIEMLACNSEYCGGNGQVGARCGGGHDAQCATGTCNAEVGVCELEIVLVPLGGSCSANSECVSDYCDQAVGVCRLNLNGNCSPPNHVYCGTGLGCSAGRRCLGQPGYACRGQNANCLSGVCKTDGCR